MRRFSKYDLYKHNTMRLHCVVDEAVFPASEGELVAFLKEYPDDFAIMGGGSNIILPNILHKRVVLLDDMPKTIEISGDEVVCSAAVRIQALIRKMQSCNLGGMEYLFSVPCMLGGAAYMNAGRGEIYNQSISDYISKVECYNLASGTVEILENADCQFGYRRSVFFNGERIILKVYLKMDSVDSSEIEKRIHERIALAKNNLDADKPSSGSIFRLASPGILHVVKGLRIGGACWSSKTENWISNDHEGSNQSVIWLIRVVQILHKLLRKPCNREVIIWK